VSYLRRVHLIAGLVTLVIFPLTGAYMRIYLADEFAASDRLRFSVRANHIYILLSSLIHISLGAYLRLSAKKRWANLQIVASLLLLISTTLVIVAFLAEFKLGIERPVTLLAMDLASGGTLLHAFIASRDRTE
jgi:NhaP-type Na+/H+ or K+/H+ antiporter